MSSLTLADYREHAFGKLPDACATTRLRIRDALPRSAIGEILQRALHDSFDANVQGH